MKDAICWLLIEATTLEAATMDNIFAVVMTERAADQWVGSNPCRWAIAKPISEACEALV